MIRISQIKLPISHNMNDLEKKICKMLHINQQDLRSVEISQKS